MKARRKTDVWTDGTDHSAEAVGRDQLLLELSQRMRELEQEDARFRTIIQTTTDAIVIVDQNGVVQFANRAAETLFGRNTGELVGNPFGFPVVAGGTMEIDIRRRDGTSAVAELKAAAVTWEGRDACLVSMRDITERKLAEQRERELIREQGARAEAEASERRSRFLAEAGDVLAESFDYA